MFRKRRVSGIEQEFQIRSSIIYNRNFWLIARLRIKTEFLFIQNVAKSTDDGETIFDNINYDFVEKYRTTIVKLDLKWESEVSEGNSNIEKFFFAIKSS